MMKNAISNRDEFDLELSAYRTLRERGCDAQLGRTRFSPHIVMELRLLAEAAHFLARTPGIASFAPDLLE